MTQDQNEPASNTTKQKKIDLLAGERQPRESYRAVQACNDYLRFGPGRSVAKLYRAYKDLPENAPPTRSFDTLKAWAVHYRWIDRAEEYDVELERVKNERAQQIMNEGLVLVHERVQRLKGLADFLERQLYETDDDGNYVSVWVPDVKQIGSGKYAERVDIERFNASIISEFRSTLDDLAKEVGGRRASVDVTSGGETIDTTVNIYLPDNDRE